MIKVDLRTGDRIALSGFNDLAEQGVGMDIPFAPGCGDNPWLVMNVIREEDLPPRPTPQGSAPTQFGPTGPTDPAGTAGQSEPPPATESSQQPGLP